MRALDDQMRRFDYGRHFVRDYALVDTEILLLEVIDRQVAAYDFGPASRQLFAVLLQVSEKNRSPRQFVESLTKDILDVYCTRTLCQVTVGFCVPGLSWAAQCISTVSPTLRWYMG